VLCTFLERGPKKEKGGEEKREKKYLQGNTKELRTAQVNSKGERRIHRIPEGQERKRAEASMRARKERAPSS